MLYINTVIHNDSASTLEAHLFLSTEFLSLSLPFFSF